MSVPVGVRVEHLDSLTQSQYYFSPCVFDNLKINIKFLLQTIHSDHYLIVLNRKIDQIIDSDLFHCVLLVRSTYMVEW